MWSRIRTGGERIKTSAKVHTQQPTNAHIMQDTTQHAKQAWLSVYAPENLGLDGFTQDTVIGGKHNHCHDEEPFSADKACVCVDENLLTYIIDIWVLQVSMWVCDSAHKNTKLHISVYVRGFVYWVLREIFLLLHHATHFTAHVYTDRRIHIQMPTHTHTHTYIHTRTHTHTYKHGKAYTNTHTSHGNIHIHIHTQTWNSCHYVNQFYF